MFVALLSWSLAGYAEPTAIVGARVFDGTKTIPKATVVIDNGTITFIGTTPTIPANAKSIDGSGKTLLPGLIDAHAHAHSAASLRSALVFGVTTELDMFCDLESLANMRDELKSAHGFELADLRSSGILVTAPHGHGTEYGVKIPTLNSAADAQSFVDARIAEGSDYIKIVYDDGSAYGVSIPTLNKATLQAVIRAAHARKKLAVVHIGTLRDAKDAIECGADGLAHLFADKSPDADFAKLVAEHHAFVVPTLTVLASVSGQSGGNALASDANIAPYLSKFDKAQLLRTYPGAFDLHYTAAEETIRQLKSLAVPILAGTDCPNPGTTHGASLHQELEFLVHAGLTPTEALVAATSVPARCFHLEDRGQIVVGKRADLVLVDGDPTTDIKATRQITKVWKQGVELNRAAFREKIGAVSAAKNPLPKKSASRLVSDFEDGKATTKFGAGWNESTDSLRGGSSTAKFEVVDGGANGSKHCLQIEGNVDGGLPYAWAGALFSPGDYPMAPADLSKQKQISFWAKGDGRAYSVMFFATSRGFAPAVQGFKAGAEWKQYTFKISDFDGLTGEDTIGVFFGAGLPAGRFKFQIDDVEFK
jgi:imidazolonepropionase-like amidohydrolase